MRFTADGVEDNVRTEDNNVRTTYKAVLRMCVRL